MSGVPPGDYNISNQSNGLFVTYNGPQQAYTVEPPGPNQVWTVSGTPGEPQTICPAGVNLRSSANTAGQSVQATADEYTWFIQPSGPPDTFIIQSTTSGLVWDLADHTVILAHITGSATQNWVFTAV